MRLSRPAAQLLPCNEALCMGTWGQGDRLSPFPGGWLLFYSPLPPHAGSQKEGKHIVPTRHQNGQPTPRCFKNPQIFLCAPSIIRSHPPRWIKKKKVKNPFS